MLKKAIAIIIIVASGYVLKAQQIPLYSQYMLNGFMINSAMAGYDGFTTFNLTARQQWVGTAFAPRTFSVTAQTRILSRSYMIKVRPRRSNSYIAARTGRVGMGISLYNDRNGYFGQTGVNLSYAYHVPFPNAQLSFGVAGSVAQYKINQAGVEFRNEGDPRMAGIFEPIYVPDANLGVYFTNNDFYAGVSAASLLQSIVKFGNASLGSYQLKRHYFIMTGYKFYPELSTAIEPSVLIKTTESTFPQVDFSLKAYYYQKYWFGLSYRTSKVAIFNAGFQVGRIYIGYSFDYSFNLAILQNTFGSHELNVSLKFGDNAKRYRWIRRY
jgi:type IX secretion system PorP/SprF family membrane protein